MRVVGARARARGRSLGGAVALVLAAWLGTSSLAAGQEGAGAEPAEGVARAVPEWQPVQGLDGPRGVFRFFLEHMAGTRDADQAGRAFDLSGVAPEERLGLGHDRAWALYEVLNRTELVVLEDLPTDRQVVGSRWVYRRVPRQDPTVAVLVGLVEREGRWCIDRDTVERLPALYERMAGLQPVGAYLDSLPLLERLHYRLRGTLPPLLLERTLLVENWQWLALLVVVFLAVLVDRLVRFVVGLLVRRITRSERVTVGTEELGNFERPVGILAGTALFQLALPVLNLSEGVHGALAIAASFVMAVAWVWAAYRLVDVLCSYLAEKARLSANKFDDMLVPLLSRTLRVFVVVVGLIFLASRWTEDLWRVVAGLSIGSALLALAAKDSVENLFGTFAVLLDKPFAIGDWILSGDMEGTVEEVGLRSTRIRTFYNSVISVPNNHFISSTVDNMGRRRYRRIKTTLGLTYDTPPEKIEAFCEGVRAILREHPYTRKDYYHVYLNGFGASSLDVLLYCFLETPNWDTELREKHRLFADILRLADELGVSFAFPTQTLHLVREDPEHPDRPPSDVAGAQRGRALGAQVAQRTLAPFGKAGPAPVSFASSHPGAADEGAGAADGPSG